jgi:adenylate kinase
MKLIFLGPPGAGKGTYSTRICEQKGWAHISTGDILRENVKNQTEIGAKAKEFMERGELVPDEIITDMVKERLQEPDAQPGFIFDGFPRTKAQAESLEKLTNIETVINLVIPDWVLVEKILARRTCENCGQIYNIADIRFGPNNEYKMPPVVPNTEGICDKCGGRLVSRSDETKEVIENRLNVYKEQTEPLIKYYRKKGILKDVDVTGSPDVMIPKIIGVLEAGK